MNYEDIEVKDLNWFKQEESDQAKTLLAQEFEDHRDTNLSFYEFLLIAKKSNEVIGIITAQRYLPKKAILCDIVVAPEYRSKGVAIKLLKEMGIKLQKRGYEYLLGYTHPKNTEALKTYKRVHTTQEEFIVTTSKLDVSIPHILQIEERLKYRKSTI